MTNLDTICSISTASGIGAIASCSAPETAIAISWSDAVSKTGLGGVVTRCVFPSFVVMGLGMMITLQALVNMGVAVGMLPVTGQTLPLISKGGSSILMVSFNIGMILSISRTATRTDENDIDELDGKAVAKA